MDLEDYKKIGEENTENKQEEQSKENRGTHTPSGKIWEERKRLWCGLPWTFTKYVLTDDRILVRTGFFNLKEDEVRLYRIKDISISKTLLQRLFGLGTIHIASTDAKLGTFEIVNVKNSYEKKEQISELVEQARENKKVSTSEIYTNNVGE